MSGGGGRGCGGRGWERFGVGWKGHQAVFDLVGQIKIFSPHATRRFKGDVSLFCDVVCWYPPTFSLLIGTPKPSAFFSLDNEFIPNSYSKFHCSIIVPSDPSRAIGMIVDSIFGDPAAFPSSIGTPDPHPFSVTVPLLDFLPRFEGFTSSHRSRIWIGGLIGGNASVHP